MAPMREAAENSDAVLPSMERRYSCSGRPGSYCVLSSEIWPSTSRPMVAPSRPATSAPRLAAISEALASRKSPDRMARWLPQRAFTLGTDRRISASSMTSSW